MEFFYFISLGMFLSYLVWVLVRFGIPSALSQSAYLFGSFGKVIFPAAIIGMAALLLPFWLEVSADSIRFLVFLAVVGMFGVGITPRFKPGASSQERAIHFGGAVTAMLMAMSWSLITFPDMIVGVVVAILASLGLGWLIPGVTRDLESNEKYCVGNSYFFWLQMTVFGTVFLSLFRLLW